MASLDHKDKNLYEIFATEASEGFHSLFPSLIYCKTLDTPDDIHERMTDYVEKFYSEQADSEEDYKPNITGDVSNNYTIHNQPEFEWLNNAIADACDQYFLRLGIDTSTVNLYAQKSWPVVCSRRGGSVDEHMHINSILSVVYYLKADDNDTGMFYFTDTHSCFSSLPIDATPTIFNMKKMYYTPKPKRLLVFPSNMMHGVDVYFGKTPRLSVSYDLIPTSTNSSNELQVTDPKTWKLL